MKKKKINKLESFANTASREGITYGQKTSAGIRQVRQDRSYPKRVQERR